MSAAAQAPGERAPSATGRGLAAIVAALVQGWRRPGAFTVIAGVAFIGAVAGALSVVQGSPNAARILAWVVGVLALAAFWFLLVYGVLNQNTPHAARLVPGHWRLLRLVLVLGWTAVVVATASVLWWSGKQPFEVRLGWSLLGLAALGLSARWPALWLSFWLVPSVASKPLTALMTSLGEWPGGAGPIAMVLAFIALGWVQARVLLGTGDAAHLLRHGRARAWLRMAARGGGVPAEAGTLMHRLARWGSLPYRSALARLCVPASTAAPWSRLMLAFGPNADWRTQLMWGALLGTVFLVLLVGLGAQGRLPEGEWPVSVLIGPVIGLMSMTLNPVTTLLASAARTAREQALLALLPGVPRGAALNHGLVGRWLARYLLSWALGSAVCVGFVAWASPRWALDCAVAMTGLLPMAVAMMPSLPHLSARPGLRQFLVSALFIVGPALCLALTRWGGVAPAWVAAAMTLAAAVGVAWRWRALARLPSAFPATRLA